jgi:PrgI family protein
MAEDKQSKIDIPESIEGYTVTLFWGLTIKQIILVFVATLFLGFGIFSLISRHYSAMLGMLAMVALSLLGIVEIRGRNFYEHLLFIFSYYKNKPRVLVYSHYSASGTAAVHTKQLVYQKDNDTKIFILIFAALALGLLILIFTGEYLYHVIHK